MSKSSSQDRKTIRPRVCIIGAGVSGLSVAEVLTRQFENLDVTIVAEDLSENIVSYVAAGIFFPDQLLIADAELNLKWAKRTYEYFKKLAQECPEEAGVQILRGYYMYSYGHQANESFPLSFDFWMQKTTGFLRHMSTEELRQKFPCHQFCVGSEYETVIADPFQYLPYLKTRFLQHGKIVQKRISFKSSDDWNFLNNQFDVVINCTGLGAAELLDDHLMSPIRGQTISVHCPEIRQFYKFDRYYVLPERNGRVVLGGVKQFGNGDVRVCEYDRQAIWENCLRLLPQLNNCVADRQDSVGLRPFRTQLCVNVTQLPRPTPPTSTSGLATANGELKVLNNYGHGGNGYVYSYAVAEHVGHLALEVLQGKGFEIKRVSV